MDLSALAFDLPLIIGIHDVMIEGILVEAITDYRITYSSLPLSLCGWYEMLSSYLQPPLYVANRYTFEVSLRTEEL